MTVWQVMEYTCSQLECCVHIDVNQCRRRLRLCHQSRGVDDSEDYHITHRYNNDCCTRASSNNATKTTTINFWADLNHIIIKVVLACILCQHIYSQYSCMWHSVALSCKGQCVVWLLDSPLLCMILQRHVMTLGKLSLSPAVLLILCSWEGNCRQCTVEVLAADCSARFMPGLPVYLSGLIPGRTRRNSWKNHKEPTFPLYSPNSGFDEALH